MSVFEPFSDITRGVVDGVGHPDNWPWGGPTDAELAEFLASLDRVRRKRLKSIAEGLEAEVISVDEYLAETGQADRSVH